MKLTRRQLVVAATAGSVAAANAFAQSGAPAATAQQPSAADFAKQSQDGVQHNRETLAKLMVPMSTEPAFQFKA